MECCRLEHHASRWPQLFALIVVATLVASFGILGCLAISSATTYHPPVKTAPVVPFAMYRHRAVSPRAVSQQLDPLPPPLPQLKGVPSFSVASYSNKKSNISGGAEPYDHYNSAAPASARRQHSMGGGLTREKTLPVGVELPR